MKIDGRLIAGRLIDWALKQVSQPADTACLMQIGLQERIALLSFDYNPDRIRYLLWG